MRALDHSTARTIIHSQNLKVMCIEHIKGGTRYQCRTRGKKKRRTSVTIVVPPIPTDK